MLVSIIYSSQIILLFSVVSKGGLSILVARGLISPEVTPAFDSPAAVSCTSVRYTFLVLYAAFESHIHFFPTSTTVEC